MFIRINSFLDTPQTYLFSGVATQPPSHLECVAFRIVVKSIHRILPQHMSAASFRDGPGRLASRTQFGHVFDCFARPHSPSRDMAYLCVIFTPFPPSSISWRKIQGGRGSSKGFAEKFAFLQGCPKKTCFIQGSSKEICSDDFPSRIVQQTATAQLMSLAVTGCKNKMLVSLTPLAWET